MSRRVVIDPTNLSGNPHLEGTRWTVFDIVIACRYEGIDELKENPQEFTFADILTALRYCAERQCDKDTSYCGGCSLRNQQDGIHNMEDFVNRFAEVRFIDSDVVLVGSGEGTMVMSGTPEELPNLWKGEDGWRLASELVESF